MEVNPAEWIVICSIAVATVAAIMMCRAYYHDAALTLPPPWIIQDPCVRVLAVAAWGGVELSTVPGILDGGSGNLGVLAAFYLCVTWACEMAAACYAHNECCQARAGGIYHFRCVAIVVAGAITIGYATIDGTSIWMKVVGVCVGVGWGLGGVVLFGVSSFQMGQVSDMTLRVMDVVMFVTESIVENVPAMVTVVIGGGSVLLASLTGVAMVCPIVASVVGISLGGCC